MTVSESPKVEACYAAPAVPVQACFAPERKPPVRMIAGVAIAAPAPDRSRYFTIESIAKGNLPIGDWKVTRLAAAQVGSDWNSLPYPEKLKNDLKELEALILKGESASLSEPEQMRMAELETDYKIS